MRRPKKPLPKSKRQYVHVFEASVEAHKIEQATPAPFPAFIEPALATLVDKPPSWHWTPFHPSEIALRCMVRNRDTGLPSTILWHFSDFGNGQAGQDLVLLTGVEANGQPMDAYAAGYFLISILQSM